MYGSNNYKESLSKSQAGIPRNVKFEPYIFPLFKGFLYIQGLGIELGSTYISGW